MHTKETILPKIVKLMALAARPGSDAEGDAARRAIAGLMAEYGITLDDIRLRVELDGGTRGVDRAPEREQIRRGFRREDGAPRPVASTAAELDHEIKPNRVHLAYDYMTAVCGIRPTFVWVPDRDKLLTFDEPCPHCLASGVIDTRRQRKRLGPA